MNAVDLLPGGICTELVQNFQFILASLRNSYPSKCKVVMMVLIYFSHLHWYKYNTFCMCCTVFYKWEQEALAGPRQRMEYLSSLFFKTALTLVPVLFPAHFWPARDTLIRIYHICLFALRPKQSYKKLPSHSLQVFQWKPWFVKEEKKSHLA